MGRTLNAILLVIALALSAAGARAQDEAAVRQAANNLSHEYTLCHVYYQIVKQCLRNGPIARSLLTSTKK